MFPFAGSIDPGASFFYHRGGPLRNERAPIIIGSAERAAEREREREREREPTEAARGGGKRTMDSRIPADSRRFPPIPADSRRWIPGFPPSLIESEGESTPEKKRGRRGWVTLALVEFRVE